MIGQTITASEVLGLRGPTGTASADLLAARDTAVEAAATASGVAANIGGLMGMQTALIAYGPSPLITGSATPANQTYFVTQVTEDGPLHDIFVQATAGGPARVIIVNGKAPNVAFVAAYPVTIAAPGVMRLTADDFGVVNVTAGQSIMLESPTGGATFANGNGGTGFYYCPPFSGGSVVLSFFGANVSFDARVRIGGTAGVIAPAGIGAADRADLRVADELATSETVFYGQALDKPNDTGGEQDFGAGYTLIFKQSRNGGPLTSVTTKVRSVGSGAAFLVILTGNPQAFYEKQRVPLPAATVVGPKTWLPADYPRIDTLDPGDWVAVYSPPGGIVQAQGTGPGALYTGAPSSPFAASVSAYEARANFTVLETRAAVALPMLPASVQPFLTAMAARAIRRWVIWVVAGQSNAVGFSQDGVSVVIPAGVAMQWYNGALTPVTQDPIGNANTKSAWPAFIDGYTKLCPGVGVIIVPTAVGATGLFSGGTGGGTWNSTGTLRAASVAAVQGAMAAATAAGLAWEFGGYLWANGESDGDLAVAQADHFAELGRLVDYLEAQLGFASNCMPFLMSRTGTRNPDQAPYTAQYKAIRDAQDQFRRSRPNVRIAFGGALNFAALGWLVDLYHYNQFGRDEMGYAFAHAAALVTCG